MRGNPTRAKALQQARSKWHWMNSVVGGSASSSLVPPVDLLEDKPEHKRVTIEPARNQLQAAAEAKHEREWEQHQNKADHIMQVSDPACVWKYHQPAIYALSIYKLYFHYLGQGSAF
jgi:hypothetical protein